MKIFCMEKKRLCLSSARSSMLLSLESRNEEKESDDSLNRKPEMIKGIPKIAPIIVIE